MLIFVLLRLDETFIGYNLYMIYIAAYKMYHRFMVFDVFGTPVSHWKLT